jgi:hypothetical protein
MYTVTSIKQTCYACPSQWEGKTDEGDEVYIRFRHGGLRLDINGETEYSEDLSDGLDGFISLEAAVRHMEGYLTLTEECWSKYNEPNEER